MTKSFDWDAMTTCPKCNGEGEFCGLLKEGGEPIGYICNRCRACGGRGKVSEREAHRLITGYTPEEWDQMVMGGWNEHGHRV